MTAPALTQYVQGQSEVSGDGLNTFLQTCDDLAQLREFIGTEGMQVYVRGISQAGGAGPGMFRWVEGGTAADDDVNVVTPAGASGIWQRTREPTIFPARIIDSGASINLSTSDGTIFVNKFPASITTLVLPPAAQCFFGLTLAVVDMNGVALTYPITISGNGQLINGASTSVINTAYGTKRLMYNGSSWNLLA